ncbi:MAG: Si-specific NAD(P)(+) transhydrogenase [Opitutales bacterium]
MEEYDLIVIGSGPAGEKAAVKAAYYGYSVALVEKETMYGGAGTNTGTLPSKTLKETALYLSGKRDKGLFGVDRALERSASIKDFFYRKDFVTKEQGDDIQSNLMYHKVHTIHGAARFVDAHTLEVKGADTGRIRGEKILIATGSYPFQPPGIPFDGKFVHDSDTILNIDRIPDSIVIVGAGVIGCEYATIFATMGCRVTLVNSHASILPWLDRQICNELLKYMEEDGIVPCFDNRVEQVTVDNSGEMPIVRAHLKGGEPLCADMFLYAAGRSGCTGHLNLEAAGLVANERQNLNVDETYKTQVDNIYAAGDVIGFPSLASTSMDQGRVAVAHMFGLHDIERIAAEFPFGIYTIPEVSTYGMSEEKAKDMNINYVLGVAKYKDMPRGRILGSERGLLKLVVDKDTHRILGVHIIGPIATELIHYGMELVESERDLNHLIGTVINSPTLHELYKYAAYFALGNVGDQGTRRRKKS